MFILKYEEEKRIFKEKKIRIEQSFDSNAGRLHKDFSYVLSHIFNDKK
jgi:hypothetical protein